MGISSILKAKGSDVLSVSPETRIREVITVLVQHRIGSVLVCEADSVVGVVSERDVVRLLGGHEVGALELVVRDVMTAPVISISPHDSIADAMALMTDRRIRHLPVMDSGRLVGIVSIGDLVKRRIEEIEQEAIALKDYITAS